MVKINFSKELVEKHIMSQKVFDYCEEHIDELFDVDNKVAEAMKHISNFDFDIAKNIETEYIPGVKTPLVLVFVNNKYYVVHYCENIEKEGISNLISTMSKIKIYSYKNGENAVFVNNKKIIL